MKEIENAVEMLSEYHKGRHYLEQSVKSVITNLYLLEAQLKAKDAEIEKLRTVLTQVSCQSIVGGFKLGENKARSIVAMLFWEMQKAKIESKKDNISVSLAVDFSIKEKMFKKAYKILKDNA